MAGRVIADRSSMLAQRANSCPISMHRIDLYTAVGKQGTDFYQGVLILSSRLGRHKHNKYRDVGYSK